MAPYEMHYKCISYAKLISDMINEDIFCQHTYVQYEHIERQLAIISLSDVSMLCCHLSNLFARHVILIS